VDNREIILEALLLHDKGEYADKIIKSILDKYSYLERFERSFINRVFIGTVERKLYLDYVINSFSTVKVNKQKPVIRAILRMSAYQLLFMNSVPDSAAINEAVKLAKKKKFNGLSGFVNGVLRKIAKEKDNIILPDRNTDIVRYLSVNYSAPEWLCEHFIRETDIDTAEIILRNSLVERPVTIRTNLSKIEPVKLLEKLKDEGVKVTRIADKEASFIIDGIDGLASLDSFSEGLYCVQDLSSQSVFYDSLEIGNILRKAKLIIDVCAAPGGKVCHVADLTRYYGNDSCRIIARDLSDIKADRIDENLNRCGFENVETQVWDALELDRSLINSADLVIADLPCSGLGVIGRKADIKYRVQPDELNSLAVLQREILKTVSNYVKPNGMLLYSTCTVNKNENIENARWIEENLGFRMVEEAKQLLNISSEYDGFFISRFLKSNE